MVRVMTFKNLLQRESRNGVPKDARPRTVRVMAQKCGISMQHMYNLMNGSVASPSSGIIDRIATNLDVSSRTVRQAIRASRAQNLVNS